MSKWVQPRDGNNNVITHPGNPYTEFANILQSPTKGFDVAYSPRGATSRLMAYRGYMYNASASTVKAGLGNELLTSKWGGGTMAVGGAYTDDTAHIQATATTLFPVSTLVDNTGFIVGSTERWNHMKIVVGTADNSGFAIVYAFHYWNGAWTSLAGYLVDTPSFAAAATTYLTFMPPGDWIAGGTPVDTVPTTRFNIRVTATTAPDTTAALIGKAKIAHIRTMKTLLTVSGGVLDLANYPVIGGVGENLVTYWSTAHAASYIDLAGDETPRTIA